MHENPCVVAICPTRGRPEWLPKAIGCFLSQTWENKRLLVLGDDTDDFGKTLPDHPGIVFSVAPARLNIGAKRNLCCQMACELFPDNELICHLDDDDFSAPGRFEDQLRRIQESGKPVTGYRDMKFTDGANWWLYRGAHGFALGTSLMYRREWWAGHRFPELQKGEDGAFTQAAASARQLADAPDMGLMYATIHAGIPPNYVRGDGCLCPTCRAGGTGSGTANTSHRVITATSNWEPTTAFVASSPQSDRSAA